MKTDHVLSILAMVLYILQDGKKNKPKSEIGMEVALCVSEGTHLALDFDQKCEAAENTYTYCITQSHVSSHLPRD